MRQATRAQEYAVAEAGLDEQGRVIIHAQLRASLPPELAIGLAVGEGGMPYLIVGPFQELEGCPGEIYHYPAKLDRQGRLLLPPYLIHRAGLTPGKGNTILLKQGECMVQVWNRRAREAEERKFLPAVKLRRHTS